MRSRRFAEKFFSSNDIESPLPTLRFSTRRPGRRGRWSATNQTPVPENTKKATSTGQFSMNYNSEDLVQIIESQLFYYLLHFSYGYELHLRVRKRNNHN